MILLKKVLIINKFDIMHECHYYTSSMRKLESDCYLTPGEQFFRTIMARPI